MTAQADSTIDIEEIISEIKADIDSRFTPEEIQEFEPIKSGDSIAPTVLANQYDADFLKYALIESLSDKQVNICDRFPGSKLSVSMKKAVKKLTSCVLVPAVADQNKFNADVVDVLFQLYAKVTAQDREIEDLKERLARLEEGNE